MSVIIHNILCNIINPPFLLVKTIVPVKASILMVLKKLFDLKHIDCKLGNLPDSILVKKDVHVLLKLYFNESEKSLFIFL